MVDYTKVNVKLSYSQIKKLKDAVKDNTGTTLRISLKMFNGNNLPHELLLTTRQKTKIRNAFNNNMSTDLKLSKAQTNKIWRIFRLITWSIIKNRITINKKSN